MRNYIIGFVLLLATALGWPAAAFELLRIEKKIPTTGTAPLLELYPGIGLNLSFLEVNETVFKIWLTDPSWATIDVEGSLEGDNPQGARIVNLKRTQDLNYEHNLTGETTTLFVVTDQSLYRFRLTKGIGTAQYDTVAITPDAEVIAVIPVPEPQSYQNDPEAPTTEPPPENPTTPDAEAFNQLKQEAQQARQEAEEEAKQRREVERRLAAALASDRRQQLKAERRAAKEARFAAKRKARQQARASRRAAKEARRAAKASRRAAQQRLKATRDRKVQLRDRKVQLRDRKTPDIDQHLQLAAEVSIPVARKPRRAERRQAEATERDVGQWEQAEHRPGAQPPHVQRQTTQPPANIPFPPAKPTSQAPSTLQDDRLPSDPVILALEIQQGLPHAISRNEIEYSTRRGSYYSRVQRAIRYLRRGHDLPSAARRANVTEKFLIDLALYGVQN